MSAHPRARRAWGCPFLGGGRWSRCAPRPGAAPVRALRRRGHPPEPEPHLDRPRHAAGADGRRLLPDRPRLLRAREPAALRRPQAARAARAFRSTRCPRSTSCCSPTTTTTTPTCPRSGAWPRRGVPFVVPRGMGDLVAGRGRPRDRARVVGRDRGRGRPHHLRPRPALLGPRPHRPQPPPLGRLRGGRPDPALLLRRRHRATSTASPRSAGGSGRPTSPRPDRRLPAARADGARST